MAEGVSCALQNEAAAMQQTLEETLARFDDVQAQTATVEEEVVDEVCLCTHFSFQIQPGASASRAAQEFARATLKDTDICEV